MKDYPRPDPEISVLLAALESHEPVPKLEQSQRVSEEIISRADDNRYAAKIASVMSKLLGSGQIGRPKG